MTRTSLLALALLALSGTAMAGSPDMPSTQSDCAKDLPADASAESVRVNCEIPAKYRQDVMLAEVIGRQIWLHDLAAWHTTDALREAHAFDRIPGDGRGWLTFQRDNAIDVRYFAEQDGATRAFAKATLQFDPPGVIGVARLATPEPMSERETRLMHAKTLVLEARDYFLCNDKAPPNTAVFEFDEDGRKELLVFVMTAWSEGDPPLGGYHMFRVSEDGSRILDHYSQTKQCLASTSAPANAVAAGVTHVTSATPTMFHVFVGLEMHKPLYVGTSQNGLLWKVENGRISLVPKSLPTSKTSQ